MNRNAATISLVHLDSLEARANMMPKKKRIEMTIAPNAVLSFTIRVVRVQVI